MQQVGEYQIFQMTTYDSVAMQVGVTKHSLFDGNDDELGARYNKEPESKIIQWVKEHHIDRDFFQLRAALSIDAGCKMFVEVKDPIIKDKAKPGDIDILAINPGKPHLSVAFQVKRIKAFITEEDIAQIHDGPLGKGVEQTQLMFDKYRFHKNYLMMLIVADTMNRKQNSQMFKYLSWEEKLPIYRNPILASLSDEIGIVSYEINQPSKNQIGLTGTLLSKEIKKAKPVDQLSSTTESIQQYLKTGGHLKTDQ